MCGCRKANSYQMRKAWEHIAGDGTIVEYESRPEAVAAQRAHGGAVRLIQVRLPTAP